MKHLTEDERVLLYYSDGTEEAEAHVAACSRCRAELDALSESLDKLAMPVSDVPDPGEDYGDRVWARLEPALSGWESAKGQGRFVWMPRGWSGGFLVGSIAAAAIILVSFLAGRWTVVPPDGDATRSAEADVEVRERILLVALGDHLRASQVLLLEVKNGPEGELTLDRARADDLVRESRLYRQTAHRVGDAATAEFLDELERLLLDVAQGPATAEGVEALRRRIGEQDVLFKLRVLETNVSEKTARRF